MRRRDFLRGVCATVSAGLLPSVQARDAASPKPLDIGLGPQLFLDDYFIAHLDGLTRQVQTPQRREKPVLDSKTFGTTQPYLTVLRDAGKKGFRIWYNRGAAIWHAESKDGISWTDPRAAWEFSHGYGASLVDDGERAAEPARRFKLANWQSLKTKEDSGMFVGFSPDGLRWTAHDKNPVLPSYPEAFPKISRHGVGDIVDVYYDSLSQRYRAAVKLNALAEDGYKPGPRAGAIFRRLVGMSASKDFIHWEKPWRILTPDGKDDGLLEFYGMGGMHLRGQLHIGLVRVLRDDLACDDGSSKDGIGYTVLATSRDGVSWTRYREPFLYRNHEKGSWDHAMTWMSGALPMGDEVFFYYGGYARGHKVAASTERQIGLARLKKDRYVALMAGKEGGTLRTRPFLVPGDRLTINAKAVGGSVRVRLLNADGKSLDSLGKPEAEPITADGLAEEVRWPKPLTALRGQPVALEMRLQQAALFGLEFHGRAQKPK